MDYIPIPDHVLISSDCIYKRAQSADELLDRTFDLWTQALYDTGLKKSYRRMQKRIRLFDTEKNRYEKQFVGVLFDEIPLLKRLVLIRHLLVNYSMYRYTERDKANNILIRYTDRKNRFNDLLEYLENHSDHEFVFVKERDYDMIHSVLLDKSEWEEMKPQSVHQVN